MLILVGDDGNQLNSQIARRFGHANFFILYDTESNSFEAFQNQMEGHNHENLLNFINRGVKNFIVGNIGPHAFNLIKEFGGKIFLARKMTVQESIEKFLAGELQELFEPTAKKNIGHKHSH